MPAPTVRVPLPGESFDSLSPLWGTRADNSPGASLLVVGRHDDVEALAAVAATPAGRRVESVRVAPGTSPAAILGALAAEFPGERIELLVPNPGPDVDSLASAAGFEPVLRQVRVGASLGGLRRPSGRRPLTFRTFAAVGVRGMVAMLASIWSGGPGPTGLMAPVALAAFIDAASDTRLWRVAYRAGSPAGVVLPLVEADGTGILLYLGLLPEWRGRGLGTALHGEALWLLRAAGAERYRDSTTPDNLAMRRLFASAGCAEIGTSVLLVRPGRAPEPAGPPARLPLGAHVSLLAKVPVRRRV